MHSSDMKYARGDILLHCTNSGFRRRKKQVQIAASGDQARRVAAGLSLKC
jgi:hypothetical protein